MIGRTYHSVQHQLHKQLSNKNEWKGSTTGRKIPSNYSTRPAVLRRAWEDWLSGSRARVQFFLACFDYLFIYCCCCCNLIDDADSIIACAHFHLFLSLNLPINTIGYGVVFVLLGEPKVCVCTRPSNGAPLSERIVCKTEKWVEN